MFFNNPILTTITQMALKKANQRIVALAKHYGTNSSIFKREVGMIFGGPMSQYADTSKSGFPKINIRKINQALRGGKLSLTEANQILTHFAGVKINEVTVEDKRTGKLSIIHEVKEIKKGGIKTVQQVRSDTKKRLASMGEDYKDVLDDMEEPNENLSDNQKLDRLAEELAEFSENFQTAYDTATQRIKNIATIKNNPITGKLWGDNRGNRRLTYKEMIEIKKELNRLSKEAKEKATSFENKNGKEV